MCQHGCSTGLSPNCPKSALCSCCFHRFAYIPRLNVNKMAHSTKSPHTPYVMSIVMKPLPGWYLCGQHGCTSWLPFDVYNAAVVAALDRTGRTQADVEVTDCWHCWYSIGADAREDVTGIHCSCRRLLYTQLVIRCLRQAPIFERGCLCVWFARHSLLIDEHCFCAKRRERGENEVVIRVFEFSENREESKRAL